MSEMGAPVSGGDAAAVEKTVRAILVDVLGLDQARAARLDDASGLFGSLPELDSLSVAGLLTELEDRLGITIDDDEVGGAMLATFGGLVAFARAKALK